MESAETLVLDTLPVPTDANWRASDSGYSAVSVLRKTPFSTTPAMLMGKAWTVTFPLVLKLWISHPWIDTPTHEQAWGHVRF